MKTTFTLALLAIAAPSFVNGQTAGFSTNHQIRMELSASLSPKNRGTLQPDYSGLLSEQLKQSEALKGEEQKLKEEIAATQRRLLEKQIAVSRLKSYIVQEAYASNELHLQSLLGETSLKASVIAAGNDLRIQAAQALKMAGEMREEAGAQATAEAQLGAMSNAEEKESLALAKQQEAIALLKQAIPLFMKQDKEFAVKEQSITPQSLLIEDELSELTQQSENLKQTAEQLRAAASGRTEQEKAAMLAEAQSMEQEYLSLQINLALSHYRNTEKTFHENRQFIQLLLTGIGNDALTEKARQLSEEADYLFRLGKEMREEADAQPTAQARLGGMSNAGEKESVAIGKQEQSVAELKKLNKAILLAMN